MGVKGGQEGAKYAEGGGRNSVRHPPSCATENYTSKTICRYFKYLIYSNIKTLIVYSSARGRRNIFSINNPYRD